MLLHGLWCAPSQRLSERLPRDVGNTCAATAPACPSTPRLRARGCECCARRAPATRPGLPRRRRGARSSGAAALPPDQAAPEEDHAASSWLDDLDVTAEFRNPVPCAAVPHHGCAPSTRSCARCDPCCARGSRGCGLARPSCCCHACSSRAPLSPELTAVQLSCAGSSCSAKAARTTKRHELPQPVPKSGADIPSGTVGSDVPDPRSRHWRV